MRRLSFAALAFFFALTPAFAAPVAESGADKQKIWFTDNRGNKFTIYRNLIRDEGHSRAQAWLEVVLPKPTKVGSGMVASLKMLQEYDCAGRTARTLFLTSYDASGATLHTNDQPEPSQPIIPETVAELELALVCDAAGYHAKNSFENAD